MSLSSAADVNSNNSVHAIDTSNGSSALDTFNSPAYYINVKVVNFAGAETIRSSPAITIDDTPPHFTTIGCVDPDHSMTEPDVYQSTTSAVGAYWDCEEDISQIERYHIMVGTTLGGDDVVQATDVQLKTKVRIDNLEGKLTDGQMYFITVSATNSAGLKSFSTCNITLDVHAPDVTGATTKNIFSTTVPDAPANTAYLTSGDRIGVQWDPKSGQAEFYGKSRLLNIS